MLRCTAYYVLSGTHRGEGYSSICEGLNGKLYVGASFGGDSHFNSYLVEFDPATEKQRIVIDTHKLCGLSATGEMAQAKIHTLNFVGQSGTIYVASKQGHPKKPWDYPGGYVMTYNPATDKAENLGKIPFRGHGVIDVVADESRGLLYMTTQTDGVGDQFWYLYDMKAKKFEGLGPRVANFITTLIDKIGRAHVLTSDMHVVTYDPDMDKLIVRPLMNSDNEPMSKTHTDFIPKWHISPDGRTAYLTFFNDALLFEFDLFAEGDKIFLKNHGPLIEGSNVDNRTGLRFGPDDKLYTIIQVLQKDRFPVPLHHLVRFDPVTKTTEDMGIFTIRNPEQIIESATNDRLPRHGLRTFTDGTAYPFYNQGMAVCRDGTVYGMFIAPFMLLRVDDFKASK